MKRIVPALCLISSLILCTSCQSDGGKNPIGKECNTVKTVQATISESAESSDATVHQHNHLSHNETKAEQESSNGNLVNYMGERIVDKNDFEIFEKYFYGKWIDQSGTAPTDVELYYSGNTFSLGFYTLVDIYTDENSAYLVTTVVGETTIYVVDFDTPNIMYEYYETNHGGKQKNQPDFIYTKTSASEENSLGFFGVLKLHYVDYIPMDVLIGNKFECSDGSVWYNYGEKISIVEKETNKITIKALCRAEGDNPNILGSAENPLESKNIIYTIKLFENDWKMVECNICEAISGNTNEGFVFYDYTGEAVDTGNVSGYTLNYAMGWQAFGGEALFKIDNTTIINDMAVTDVYSEYSVFPTLDGYGVNYCEGGYSLVSAEDAFEGISVKGILQSNGTNWILRIIREETDEYFFDISVGGTLKLEEAETNSTATIGEQSFNVQPMGIIIRNADEFDEINALDVNSVYMADLTLEAISFNAYAQDADDSPATLLTSVTFLRNVNIIEIL